MHIHRSDSVTTLDVRIDKSDLNRLDLDSLLEIQSDPTTFILSTHIPLLYISKQMAFSSTEPSIETYFRWTPPNGACFPNMIQQLEYRHVNKLHHQQHLIPPIDIQTEKGKSAMSSLLRQLSSSLPTHHEEQRRIFTLQHLIQHELPVDAVDYLSVQLLPDYKLTTPSTGWVSIDSTEKVVHLAYASRLPHLSHFICTSITVNDYQTISDSQNDFHFANEHCYIVPCIDNWSQRYMRLSALLVDMAEEIKIHASYVIDSLLHSSRTTRHEQVRVETIELPIEERHPVYSLSSSIDNEEVMDFLSDVEVDTIESDNNIKVLPTRHNLNVHNNAKTDEQVDSDIQVISDNKQIVLHVASKLLHLFKQCISPEQIYHTLSFTPSITKKIGPKKHWNASMLISPIKEA